MPINLLAYLWCTHNGRSRMSDTQRVAIVTGASGGIGAAVATRLAKDGFAVVINYSSKQAPAADLVQRIEAEGGRAMACKADVSDAASVASMFDAATKIYGGIDVLVNCAGMMKLATLAEVDDASIDQHLSVNLKGTINTLRQAAKSLRDGGRIINFSSSVIGLYQPTYAVYAATKAGVEALTHVLAKEMRGRGITVNAVSPGPTATHLFLDDKDKKTIEAIANAAPLGRLGEPDDIANVVAFLAGPDGGWINGQIVRANGGIV
jgi:3-oxoacyl-[acyl-carrier protein] reductase